jgi:NNP family nitrate/nitrite transporter-like MFS transporter
MSENSTSLADESAGPRLRVLWLSTFSFTVLFAVWLMLGVLGLKIKADTSLMLGDAAGAMSQQQIQTAIESRFEWLLAISILAGAMLRLNFGIWSDVLGGRNMMALLLAGCAIPTAWLGYAQSFTELLVCSALFGLAGNAFAVGVAWNSAWFPTETKGTALGVFGAGNVGAAGAKLLVILAPGALTLIPAAGLFGGIVPGGWRIVPLCYAVLLVITAGLVLAFSPRPDRKPGRGRRFAELVAPLKAIRVWRFSLYYVAVFGAYVALSAWLPSYYVATYEVDLRMASLLTAMFIFPASLLRPVGGWLSDRYGARVVTYVVLAGMSLAIVPLCLPESVLALGVGPFTALMVIVAVGMGIGKASVFKYIPQYFPGDVGAVGGLVGLLGALGGFVLPKAFGWLGRGTGFPQAAFLALLAITVVSLAWLHATVRSLRAEARRPTAPALTNAAAPGVAATSLGGSEV